MIIKTCFTVFFTFTSGELTGDEYKKQLINSLCSSRWNLFSICNP